MTHEVADSNVVAIPAEKVEASTSMPIETPGTLPSDTPSDNMSTQPTTPSSATTSAVKPQQTPTQSRLSRAVIPVVPIIPAMPSSPVAFRNAHRDSVTSIKSKTTSETGSTAASEEVKRTEPAPEATPPPPPPKSWADLVRKQSASTSSTVNVNNNIPVVNGISAPKTESLGEVLGELSVADAPSKVVFLEPRGLVNSGNMCYMNSVRCYSYCSDQDTLADCWYRFCKLSFFAFLFTTSWIKLLRKPHMPSRALRR